MDFFKDYGALLAPVGRELEYNGRKATFYFRELTVEQAEALFAKSDDPEARLKQSHALLIETLCDKDGAAVITEATVKKMPGGLMRVLLDATMDVHGYTEKAKEEAGNEP